MGVAPPHDRGEEAAHAPHPLRPFPTVYFFGAFADIERSDRKSMGYFLLVEVVATVGKKEYPQFICFEMTYFVPSFFSVMRMEKAQGCPELGILNSGFKAGFPSLPPPPPLVPSNSGRPYGADGSGRAPQAARLLSRDGYWNIAVMAGGYNAWARALH